MRCLRRLAPLFPTLKAPPPGIPRPSTLSALNSHLPAVCLSSSFLHCSLLGARAASSFSLAALSSEPLREPPQRVQERVLPQLAQSSV